MGIRRCAQQHLLTTLWICLLSRTVGSSPEPGSCGPLCVAGSKEHRRLSDAASRVAKAVSSFDHLREALHAEPQQVLEDLRSKLNPMQAEALAGEDSESKSLQARFATLQGRVMEVQRDPPAHGNAAPRGIPLHTLEMDVTSEVEQMALDLEAHLVRLKGYTQEHLHMQSSHWQEPPVVQGHVSTTPTVARSTGKTMHLHATPPSPPRNGAVGDEVKALADATAQRVLRLTERTRQLANPQLLQEARRLAASLAHAVEGSDALSKVKALSKEAERLTAEAERALELQQSRGASSHGPAPQQPFGERGSTATGIHGTAAIGAAGGVCSEPSVRSAAAAFDEILRGFREGGLVRSMLPPELENLHRVVHSMEVLRHTLLDDLRVSGDRVNRVGLQLTKDCQRYFDGVRQLQADLAYYQGAARQQRLR